MYNLVGHSSHNIKYIDMALVFVYSILPVYYEGIKLTFNQELFMLMNNLYYV